MKEDLIDDRTVLRRYAYTIIEALPDDLSTENALLVLAMASAATILALSNNKMKLRTGPDMFAKLLKEILKGADIEEKTL